MPFLSEKLLILDEVDSTNNYAMAMIQNAEKNEIKPVFALQQTLGKGRRGKRWVSNKGENIILSIPFQMEWLPLSCQFELSVAIALSCYDLFSKYILANLFIKWPNDIYINDSKTGGILIENKIKGTLWQWSIIGIGLNINQMQFDDSNLKATSLQLITGNAFDIIAMAEELVELVFKRIGDIKSGSFEKMLKEYNDHLYAKNKTVRLKKGNIIFETKILKVSQLGQLLTADSIERRFNFDEIEFKGIINK